MPRRTTDRLIKFNRDNILETAERLFSEKGIAATTVDGISKAADCSKSTIYVYFSGKDEIFNFLVYNYMCSLCEMFKACIAEYENFEQCYFSICHALVGIYNKHPIYFESMMGNISIDEKELRENEILRKIYNVGEMINDSMMELFNRGQKENYLREDLLTLPTVYTLWASLTNAIIIANNKESYIEKRIKMDKREFMEYSFKLLLASIKRG